jgi:hypothetical protein
MQYHQAGNIYILVLNFIIFLCEGARCSVVPWNHILQSQFRDYPSKSKSKSKSKSHSVSKSWCRAPSGAHGQTLITLWQLRSCFVGRPLWREDGSGLSFVYAAGPCHRSLSRIRVPWDSRPYFTVSDLRLPFSSPPTTRRVTVEVFDPASTRRRLPFWSPPTYKSTRRTEYNLLIQQCLCPCVCICCRGNVIKYKIIVFLIYILTFECIPPCWNQDLSK